MAEFLKIGNVTADSKFSQIVEPNYFADNVLIEGLTYTDKYELGAAGQVLVHKINAGTVEASKIGGDFDSEEIADELITINLDVEFRKDKKVLGVQEATVGFDRSAKEMSLLSEAVREARQAYGLATIVKEGTVVSGKTITASNIDAEILAARKALRDAKSNGSAIICSTDVYNILLTQTARFTPVSNETLRTKGIVGSMYGMPVIEANALQGSVTLLDKTVVSLEDVNFIMLNAEAFSVLDVLQIARVKDSENFYGVRCQVQTNVGFKVTNPELVIINSKASE